MKQECEEVEYLVIYLLLLSYAKMVKILVFYGEEFSKKKLFGEEISIILKFKKN